MDEVYAVMINNLVLTLVATIVLALIVFLLTQWRRLTSYIDQKKRESEAKGADSFQSTLWSVAQEAYVFAETKGKGIWESKSHQAFEYASQKMKLLGLNVTPEQLEAKIQEAWLKLDKKNTQQASIEEAKKLLDKQLDELIQR